MLVPVLISRLLIREMADSQFVTLQEVDGPRRFPIAIGLTEAFAIERRLQNATPLRPQTHDLLDAVIRALGATLERIEISDLQGGTFFARLVLERDGERIEVDSRPSDALALGAAYRTPILVEDAVLEEASQPGQVPDGMAGGELIEDEDDDDDDDAGFA
jgi:bifunctional DNase/RNase